MPHLETDIALPKSLEPFPSWITKSAQVSARRAVEKIATYFQRELGYDFIQYAAADHDKNCVVYSWDDQCFIRSRGEMGYQMVGAACFRYGKRMGPSFEGWFLQWVWLHPYFRHNRYLSEAWPRFVERFGPDFLPEFPYSIGMKSFLRKHATLEQIAGLSRYGDIEKYLTHNWRDDSQTMPITSVSLSKFVPEELQLLVLRFLLTFARFECALKRAGFLSPDGKARPQWDSFAASHENSFCWHSTPMLRAAWEYLEAHPPRIQISDNGQLGWSEAQPRSNEPRLTWLLTMVRRVRNNLFHGGKYPMIPVDEPARNEDLLKHSLIVLHACLQLDGNVARHFEPEE